MSGYAAEPSFMSLHAAAETKSSILPLLCAMSLVWSDSVKGRGRGYFLRSALDHLYAAIGECRTYDQHLLKKEMQGVRKSPRGFSEMVAVDNPPKDPGTLKHVFSELKEIQDALLWEGISKNASTKTTEVLTPTKTTVDGGSNVRRAQLIGDTQHGAALGSKEVYFALLYVAPHTTYAAHTHDLQEVCHILSGTCEWFIGDLAKHPSGGAWDNVEPAEFRHHPSEVQYTVRTREEPVLAVCFRYADTAKNRSVWPADFDMDMLPSKVLAKGHADLGETLEAYDDLSLSYKDSIFKWGYSMPTIVVDVCMHDLDFGNKPYQQLKVLDIGCGDGLVGAALKRGGIGIDMSTGESNIVGCDVSNEMIKIAREKDVYVELIKADISKPLPLKANMFDLLLLVGTSTNLQPIVLRDWLKHMRKGAYFVAAHKTTVWPKWEIVQQAMIDEGLLSPAYSCGPQPYFPGFSEENDVYEGAKVYVFRKL